MARSGETLDVTNPATGERIALIPRGDTADVDGAVEAARAAFPEWSRAHPLERAALLTRLADAIEARGDELAGLDALDNGSPLREMRRDIGTSTTQLRYFAGLALQLRGQTIPVGEAPRLHAAPAVRRRRPHRPVQPPADVRRDEDRRAAGGGQHRRAQALRAHVALGARARRRPRRDLPARRRQRRHGLRRRGRRRARRASRRAAHRVHRVGRRPASRSRPAPPRSA